MNKFQLIIISFLLSACSDQAEVNTLGSLSDLWIDNGVPCAKSIQNSAYNLNNLPSSIEVDLVDYLNMEQGSGEGLNEFDLSRLKYVGEYEACDQTMKLWKHVCEGEGECFVGVLPDGNGYMVTTVYPSFEI